MFSSFANRTVFLLLHVDRLQQQLAAMQGNKYLRSKYASVQVKLKTFIFVFLRPRYLTSRGKSSSGKRRRSVRRRGTGRSFSRVEEVRTRTCQKLLLQYQLSTPSVYRLEHSQNNLVLLYSLVADAVYKVLHIVRFDSVRAGDFFPENPVVSLRTV